MSNTTVSSLSFASQQVVIYVGFSLFVAGLVGNPLTLVVFVSLRTFRQSSCAFYLTMMSFVNTFHLFTGLLTYIMINGFAINWLNMSIFYCKFRPFYVQICLLTSFSCMCLATIDQFLATCSNPRCHQWNNIKVARYLLIGVVMGWILYASLYLFYSGHILSVITGKMTCGITNVIYQKYVNVFYLPVLTTILPTIIMIVFGVLAYRNIKRIAYRTVPLVRRELDKQLTLMVLVQVFYDVIVILPSGIVSIFTAVYGTPSNALVRVQLSFITSLVTIMYYFHFVGSFYIYVCVSKRFRQQLIHVLVAIHLDRYRPRRVKNNQTEPQT